MKMGGFFPVTITAYLPLNCGGEDFAIACMRSNLKYGKNQKRGGRKEPPLHYQF